VPSPRIRAHGDLSGGAGGENIFFHFRGEGNQNVQALAQGQAVTYTTGVGRNGHLAAENVVPSSGGGGGAGGAPKGAAACGKSNRHMEKPTAAAVSQASSMRKEQVPSWEDDMRRLRDSHTTLTELKLTPTYIGEDRLRELGEALADNSTLTALHLGGCGITAAGAAHLAEGVGKSASLATLDLRGNYLGNSGAQALGAALAATSTLTSLNLGGCGITAAGAAHLVASVGKSASLATLDLKCNKIGNRGAQALGAALPTTSTLTSLHLSYCGITAAGASHLGKSVGKSASLATLNLWGNDLGNSGATALGAALGATSTLTSLILSSCGITAAGAAHLAEGVRKGPPRRVPLTLHGVDLGRVAAQVGLGHTAGGWNTDQVLAALNVKCAAATPSGAGTGGLGPGARGGVGEGAGIFKRPDTKKRASTELSDAPTETCKDSKRNKGPVKEKVRDIINKGLCLDSNIPEHERARLFKLHHDSGLKVLEAFKELMSKNKGAEKKQLFMQSLERVPLSLSGVDLGWRLAPAPAPAPMQEASQPVFGKLSCVGKQTDKMLAALNVKCAAARPSGAGTGGLGPGARGGEGEGAAAEAAGAGGGGGGEGEGGGGSAKGREAGAAAISEAPSMRKEEVPSWEHNVRRLRDSDTTLTELRLTHTSIGEDRLRELGEALADNSTLTSLHLGGCGITAAGAAHLAEGVGKSASLATLDLKCNKIGNRGAQALGAALAATSTLTSLHLSYCGITAAGASHLAWRVGKSASLATLNLWGNDLGNSGATALGAALGATSTLTSLILSSCGITAAGAAHLAEGVRKGPPRRVPLTLHGVDLGRVAAQVGLGHTAGGWNTDQVLAALNVKCAAATPSGAGTGGLGPGARGGVGEGAAEAAGAGGVGGGRGGEGGGGSVEGRAAALRLELEVVKSERKSERDAAIRELRWKEEATRRELEVVKRERDAAITLEDLQARFADKSQQAKKAEADCVAIKAQYSQAKTQLNGLKAQLLEVQEALAEKTANLEVAVRDKESQAERAEERLGQIEELRTQLSDKVRENTNLVSAKDKAVQEANSMRGQLVEAQANFKEEALRAHQLGRLCGRELRSREEATRRAEAAVGARDEAIRSKDAEIGRLRKLAYGVEVLDVDAGVTRVVEEAGAGAEPSLKRMRLEQAASARVVVALQERLVAVKKEQVEERATRHSELRASVDAKVKAAVKEALAQVADALECVCCFEPLAPGAAVALECGHTYCNRQACASSSVTECPECRQPIGARVPLFGVLANVCGLLPRDA
jgi:Ran GTPase-activating protein (RanGAP) involved in mRNA processing and transport/cold shock CspA family protein